MGVREWLSGKTLRRLFHEEGVELAIGDQAACELIEAPDLAKVRVWFRPYWLPAPLVAERCFRLPDFDGMLEKRVEGFVRSVVEDWSDMSKEIHA